MLSVGIFVDEDKIQNLTRGRKGLIYGGGFTLLGIQLVAVLAVLAWTLSSSFIMLKVTWYNQWSFCYQPVINKCLLVIYN